MKRSYVLYLLLLISLGARADDPAQQKPEFRHVCPDAKKIQNKLLIHHIAVGQGDSTFIRTPKGLTILIDGGVPSRGRNEILPVLQNCYKLSSLDYVVLTHFDLDHQGGLTEVLQGMPVKKAVYDPGDRVNGKNDDPKSVNGKYRKAANDTKKRKIPVVGYSSIRVPSGDPVKIEFVAVAGKLSGGGKVDILDNKGEPKDDNAVSIAMVFRFMKFDYFIGGDLTGGGDGTPDVETPVADLVGDVDVLHANHHGSKTSNNEHFLNQLKAENVIISVGEGGMNNKYKLPTAEVVERMHNTSAIKNIFMTAKGESEAREAFLKKIKNEEGDIVVIAEPGKYSINGKEFATDGEGGATH
jgi:competence protein ComEC